MDFKPAYTLPGLTEGLRVFHRLPAVQPTLRPLHTSRLPSSLPLPYPPTLIATLFFLPPRLTCSMSPLTSSFCPHHLTFHRTSLHTSLYRHDFYPFYPLFFFYYRTVLYRCNDMLSRTDFAWRLCDFACVCSRVSGDVLARVKNVAAHCIRMFFYIKRESCTE